MKIYIAYPLTGRNFREVESYILDRVGTLNFFGYEVFHPLIFKSHLRKEKSLKAGGYKHPLSCDHAIIERDFWMINHADIIYMNLLDAEKVSIGCMMELAWAYQLRKHVVLIMEEGNVHDHAFVREAADVLFDNEVDALNYLRKLINREI